jgi:membrane dipeptidase
MAGSLSASGGRVRLLWALLVLLAGCGHRGVTPSPASPGIALRAGADLHVHLIMRSALAPWFQGEPDSGVLASSPTQAFVNPLDSATLQQAGVRLVVVALWPPFDLRPGRTALDEALGQLRALHEFARRHSAFGVATDAASARALMAQGRIALLPSIEGGGGISRVEEVDVLYAAGARSLGLVHFTDNRLGDARDAQLGTALGPVLNGSSDGLTPLGRQVVRRMMSLGMVVDVSHASERTMRDVLALTELAGVPIIASHEGAAHASVRTVTPAMAVRIGASGGLIGIGLYRNPIAEPVPEEERWPGHQPDTCDDVVAHWLYYQRLAGERAVVLGSDLGTPTARPLPGPGCPQGIRNSGDLPALFSTLVARGVSREGLEDSAHRVLHLLERVEAVSSPEARANARRLRVFETPHFASPL